MSRVGQVNVKESASSAELKKDDPLEGPLVSISSLSVKESYFAIKTFLKYIRKNSRADIFLKCFNLNRFLLLKRRKLLCL